MPKKKTNKQFIEEAKIIDINNNYSFEKVKYKGAHIKVDIFCKSHKEYFSITPSSFLSGSGCSKCYYDSQRKTQEKFIEEAKIIDINNNYSFEKVKYKSSRIKVDIFCKKHNGYFSITPNKFLNGGGCGICNIRVKKTTEYFIEEAKIIDINNNYSFEKVKYKGSGIKVDIFCKKHKKVFIITPSEYLKGYGCPYCSGKKKTQEKFIEEAKLIDINNNYSFEKVKYIHTDNKVDIFCKSHKEYFSITPSNFLCNHGCPKCATSHKGDGYIYIIRLYNNSENFIKIGLTQSKSERRFSDYKRIGYNYDILLFKKSHSVSVDEKLLHIKCNTYKYVPMIDFGGKTECFNLGSLKVLKEELLDGFNELS